MRQEVKTLVFFITTVVLVVVAGTVGYRLIEGWTLLESLYMTVITIFTVGFKEIRPLSTAGLVFTMVVIVFGVGAILYGLGRMVEFVIGGQLSGTFKRRAVKRQVDRLDGHFIICGYGRVGRSVAHHLLSNRATFLVVDSDPDSLAQAEADGLLTVRGDATADEVLEEAGVLRAKGLIAAVGSDAGNIYVTLSARVLNPALLIVARAASDDTVSKLERAGADHVVSPYGIGGKRMATLVLDPQASRCLDVVIGGGESEFRVEEFALDERCCAAGRSIEELAVRERTGALILAVRRSDAAVLDTDPSPETRLGPGDRIIAVGTPTQMTKLHGLITAPAAQS